MNREAIDSILDTVRNMSPDERIAFADEVDRLAWRDRVHALLGRVAAASEGQPPITDEEIDSIVAEVRAETPLSERYWIHRQQSVPSSEVG